MELLVWLHQVDVHAIFAKHLAAVDAFKGSIIHQYCRLIQNMTSFTFLDARLFLSLFVNKVLLSGLNYYVCDLA
jgi:hypothetical protein